MIEEDLAAWGVVQYVCLSPGLTEVPNARAPLRMRGGGG